MTHNRPTDFRRRFIPPTPIEGIESARRVLVGALAPRFSEASDAIALSLNGCESPSEVAKAWKQLIDDDRYGTRDAALRNARLVLVLDAFERLRLQDYVGLKFALAQIATIGGRPMSVLGTRCELASRTAEGLYLEARRTPSDENSQVMLRLAESLITVVLTDCRQRDDPSYLKRWRGIRGACRLMLAVQEEDDDKSDHHKRFVAAADDLEAAFQLGNRGSSAVAYLLDALLHLIESDFATASARFDTIAPCLTVEEKQNRSVLFLLGRYSFARSFKEPGDPRHLDNALQLIDQAMRFPPDLSSDDVFLRQVRGQTLVRLSMAQRDIRCEAWIATLDAAIVDLQFAFEAAPAKFGKQLSLQAALVTRAEHFLRNRSYAESIAHVDYLLRHEVLVSADPANARRAELLDLLARLRQAQDDNDLPRVAILLDKVLGHPECSSQAAVAASIAARHLFSNKTTEDDPTLLKQTVGMLDTVDIQVLDTPSHRMHLSLKGRLSLLYARWRPEALENAVAYCVAAVDADPDAAEPELLGMCGESLLQFAKYQLSVEERTDAAIDALEDAGDYFDRAARTAEVGSPVAGPGFQLAVTYSKAGESYLRLCTLTGSADAAHRAIDRFEKAHAAGNTTAALLGLLGDSYYKIFQITKRPDALTAALAHKGAARDAGHTSRENLSLSAKLSFAKWELTGNIEDLSKAIALCGDAHEVSPSWPWPAFQLAEILDSVDPKTLETLVTSESARGRLLQFVAGGRGRVVEYGCQLVIADEEFRKRLLGGRQPVYVLDDPHRLLSSTYVFKHTQAHSAHRDRQVIDAFRTFLSEKNVKGLGLPTPVAIVPFGDGDETVYVMRRASGFHLGRLAARARAAGLAPPAEDFERALMYLAAYHAWGFVRSSPPISVLHFVTAYTRDSLGMAADNLPKDVCRLLSAVGRVPQVLKKDAHPENWLIDERGRISMLDFESSRSLPFPFEVVQLLDDYPVLPLTEDGWTNRHNLCRQYVARIEELIGKEVGVDVETLNFLYVVFLILRARFGTRQTAKSIGAKRSSSALRATQSRISHYREVLSWVSAQHPLPAIRALAATMQGES